MSEGPFRPQERHFERLLLRQAGRHDFAKQPRDLFIAERSLIALERHPQNVGFALGAIEIHGLAGCRFGDADQLGEAGAFVEQRMDSRIDGIDAVADIAESAGDGRYPRPLFARRAFAGAAFAGAAFAGAAFAAPASAGPTLGRWFPTP